MPEIDLRYFTTATVTFANLCKYVFRATVYLAKTVAPKLSHALRKNFTDAPVPFRTSGKTFNVCDLHYF